MKKRTLLFLCGLLLFVIAAAALIYKDGSRRKAEAYDTMRDASERYLRALECIRNERLRRGIPLSAEDTLGLGLIGLPNSAISTSVGDLEAKRTAELPEMAALCVRLFAEAGLKEGDTLAACFSGSFPGIDLAAVCAADAMGLRIVYSAAVGASFYGANIPEYTAPEMLMTAYEAGLIGSAPALVTMGGENDAGTNMTGALMEETEEIEAVKARLAAEGLAVTPVASLDEAVRLRLGICGNPAAFVNVGGNVAGIGRNAFALENSYGILAPQRISLNAGSGLMEYYLNEGIPVISFLNIKKLCLEYGIAFDPDRLPEPGTEGVYYERRYDRGLIAAVGAVTFAALIFIEKDRKKSLRQAEKH